MPVTKGRRCSKCGVYRLLASFSKKEDGKFGKHSQCNKCRSIYFHRWFKNLTPEQYEIHKERSRIAAKKRIVEDYRPELLKTPPKPFI